MKRFPYYGDDGLPNSNIIGITNEECFSGTFEMENIIKNTELYDIAKSKKDKNIIGVVVYIDIRIKYVILTLLNNINIEYIQVPFKDLELLNEYPNHKDIIILDEDICGIG
jgi:hypothetical protein